MLKEKIRNKEKIIGTHINFCDPSVGRIAGLAGYDFIWIDMEHNYISFESLLSLIIAVKSAGTDVIVRAPQDDLTATKKIIEMGPDGIIFPMVKSAEEANRLLSYTLYPPYGKRGFGPMNAVGYGAYDTMEYVSTNHDTMCRFVQIEHVDAVNNLDEIMKNKYIDGYIIGANDLSGSINELCNVFGENTTALSAKESQKNIIMQAFCGYFLGFALFQSWSNSRYGSKLCRNFQRIGFCQPQGEKVGKHATLGSSVYFG